MAKQIIKTKNNFIDGLKKFTNAIVAQKLDEEVLNGIIEKYKIDNTIIKKLISYVSGNSHVLIYLNKYLNKLGGNYSLVDYIKAYRYILQCNSSLDSRGFFYFKATDCTDPMQKKIIDLLGEYFFLTTGIRFHYRELLFYYDLFLIGEISHDDIYHADVLVNNGQQTIELSGFIPPKPKNDDIVSIQKVISSIKSTTGGIEKINSDAYQMKLDKCKDCKFFQNPFLAVDGNLVNGDSPDVVLINLGPSLDDFKNKKMYKEGSFLRKQIEEFPEGTRWLMINLIPCAFKSRSSIGSTDNVKNLMEQCYSVVQNTIETFKADLYILIGEEVAGEYTSEPFTDALGKLIDNKFIIVHHPSNLRNPKAQIKGKEIWRFVQEHLKDIEINPNNKTDEPIVIVEEVQPVKEDVQESQVIVKTEEIIVGENKDPAAKNEKTQKSRPENLLLLDVRELRSGKVLMVFTDKDGNKYYEQKDKKQTGYIKDKDFKECGILSESVDLEFSMNGYQNSQLKKLLREKLSELKKRGN